MCHCLCPFMPSVKHWWPSVNSVNLTITLTLVLTITVAFTTLSLTPLIKPTNPAIHPNYLSMVNVILMLCLKVQVQPQN